MTFGSSRLGPSGYVQAKGCPFVDGVFVPGGDGSLTQVSSMHHAWKDCPRTSGVLPMGPCNDGPVGLRGDSLVLNGVQYGVPRHPALFMHSNAGITFDLQAIRKCYHDLHKGLTPTGFKTVAGLSDAVLTQWPGQMDRPPVAGLWVLVDGETRWKKTDLVGGADPVRIDVPLEPDAAFLTIVVTEGEDLALSLDWVVLGDPIIALSCD